MFIDFTLMALLKNLEFPDVADFLDDVHAVTIYLFIYLFLNERLEKTNPVLLKLIF